MFIIVAIVIFFFTNTKRLFRNVPSSSLSRGVASLTEGVGAVLLVLPVVVGAVIVVVGIVSVLAMVAVESVVVVVVIVGIVVGVVTVLVVDVGSVVVVVAELHPRAKRACGQSSIAKEMW